MKMCVSKKMWNWKDVLAKRGDIANVCYLKGSVIRKGVLFKKMCYEKGVLSKRCVILLKACYRKRCVISKDVLSYTPWVSKRCVIQRCVNERRVKKHTKVCFLTHQGVFSKTCL